MRKAAMVLAATLIAGSAMADGGTFVTSGGRTDDNGSMGSGCGAATQTQTQSNGYFGSGLASSQDAGGILLTGGGRDGGGGTIGSGTRSEAQQRTVKREFRLFGFLIALFD